MKPNASPLRYRPEIQANVLARILSEAGLTPRQRAGLLNSEGLSEQEMADPKAKIALNAYMRIFSRMAEVTGDELIGLRVSSRMGPETVGAIGYVFMCAATLEEAIAVYSRHVFSIQEVTEFLYTAGTQPMVSYAVTDDAIRPRRQDVEFSLGYVFTLVKQFLGGSFRPREIYFEHARPNGPKLHESFFGCPVYFEQETNSIVFEPEDLKRVPATHDPHLSSILLHYIFLSEGTDLRAETLTSKIHDMLGSSVPIRSARLDQVSRKLNVSPATLRRSLSKEGTSFREILRRKRIEMAARLLMEETYSILEVAQRCGYSETASFTRAFIQELGQAPSQYRRGERQG